MGGMISLQQALELVRKSATPRMAVERVPLAEALGRRLAQDYRADTPWPTTDRSAMDGFALAAGGDGVAEGTELDVVGECLAGHPFDGEVGAGQAIRMMTGAVIPPSVDAVVPVENTSGYEGDKVVLRAPVKRGDHIRPVGSEVAQGELLLGAGTRIRSAEVGALAVLGIAEVPVYRRPRVAILPTGDEVVSIEREPLPHQVRESNSWALAAQVLESGAEPVRLPTGRDDRHALMQVLTRGLEADVLLTIGGVSKGTHDLVHACLRELGVEEIFFGIALKPGKPTFFGHQPEQGRFVFGLPGNPASTYAVFDLLVRPLLAGIQGGAVAAHGGEVQLGGAPFRRNRRLQAIPARLALGEGSITAELTEMRPSGNPFGLLPADGYALVDAELDPDSAKRAPFCAYGDGWPRA